METKPNKRKTPGTILIVVGLCAVGAGFLVGIWPLTGVGAIMALVGALTILFEQIGARR
ncbi:MAG: hypothetical protein LBE08_02855 [Bifidobacteriaceae bacterium]|jgi:fatty acid desaturase|nr:hypothetical protein [Bifidobacteriaceae bacterium]